MRNVHIFQGVNRKGKQKERKYIESDENTRKSVARTSVLEKMGRKGRLKTYCVLYWGDYFIPMRDVIRGMLEMVARVLGRKLCSKLVHLKPRGKIKERKPCLHVM